jgi:hypothetical protein
MTEDDAEQRIAELERQLAEAKAANEQQVRAQPAEGAAPQSSFPPPPQVSFSPPVARTSWTTTQVFVNGQPVVPGPTQGAQPLQPFPGAPFGPPMIQPPGPAAFRLGNYRAQRLVRSVLSFLWIGTLGALIFGISQAVKMHKVTEGGHTARCGNVFDATFGHDAFYQYGGADDLRATCAAEIAKAQPMAWGLIALGVLLLLGSLIVMVISWMIKWRSGWRPWRPWAYGSPY